MPDTISTLADLVADWQGGVGTFTDEAGTSPATAQDALVRRWEDQHGGSHLTTAGTPPTVVAESPYKGQPGVSFVGASGHSLHNDDFDATSGVTEGTWVIAYDRAKNGQTQFLVDSEAGNVLAVTDNGGLPTLYHQTGNLTRFADNAYHGKLGIFRYDGALSSPDRMALRLNRADPAVAQVAGTIGGSTLSLGPGLWVGSSTGGANGLTGTILRLAYVARAITDEECDAIVADLAASTFAEGAKKVFVLGDSIPFGYPLHTSDGDNWPTMLGELLGDPWTVQVNAAVAQTITQMENSGIAAIDPDFDDWRDRQVVIHECGTNDGFQEHTAAQALTDMETSVTNRHAQGFTEVYVQTLPYALASGVSAPATDEEYEAFRAAYNAGALAGDTGADDVFDLAAVNGFIDPVDTSYYTGDLVHFDTAGAAAAAAAAFELITGLPVPPPAPTLTDTPDDPSTGSVSFSFTDADIDATFECALDGGSYAACVSPKTYAGLTNGAHTFAVRAVNAGGTSSSTSFSWDVVVPLPTPSAGTGAALLMVG